MKKMTVRNWVYFILGGVVGAWMASCGELAYAQPSFDLEARLVLDLMDAQNGGNALLASDLREVLTYGLAAPPDKCPKIPAPAIAGTEKICHTAYVSLFDPQMKEPRLVVYELTGPHTLGCVARASNFHSEGDSAKPDEYIGSGYDLGHMDPAQDNAWDPDVSRESFSMVNVAPQEPELNRQEWERLEEDVRAWAWERGDLLVYVGPIFPEKPKLLKDIGIPIAFYKVIVDRKSGLVLAFQMPQRDIPKGDLTPWLTTLKTIEAETGIKFGLKGGEATVWPADLAGWHKAHKAACGGEEK